jgi:hypothetical protein
VPVKLAQDVDLVACGVATAKQLLSFEPALLFADKVDGGVPSSTSVVGVEYTTVLHLSASTTSEVMGLDLRRGMRGSWQGKCTCWRVHW